MLRVELIRADHDRLSLLLAQIQGLLEVLWKSRFLH